MAHPTLIQQTGRAAFWNAVLFPLRVLLSFFFGILVARRFELDAGIYNTAVAVVTSGVMFTSLGIPTSLTKFLPEITASAGPAAAASFLLRSARARLWLLLLFVVPLNVFAAPASAWLDLGPDGVPIIRLATVLIVARAVIDLCIRTLNAFFGQLRSNTIDIFQGSLDFILAGSAIIGGFAIAGVFGMVVLSGVVTALMAVGLARGMLTGLEGDERGRAFEPADPQATRDAVDGERGRFAGFALFTFLFEMSIYFSDKSFAAPALAAMLGREAVAIFSYGFSPAFMTVGLMVSSFRGLYRPMFAHLRTRNDPEQLRRAFSGVSKAQLIILMPAGVGLTIMAPDYIPLLYDREFLPSVPIAQVFAVLLYTHTAFNLGIIWLSIDERYRAVLWTQSIQVAAVPVFLLVAVNWGLVAASIVFGGARVLTSVTGYIICRRDYEFRFPWAFAAKVGGVVAVMGVALALLRQVLPQTPEVAIGLTALGAAIYFVGLRIGRVLGPEELDLLDRSDVPGKRLALAWLAPKGK